MIDRSSQAQPSFSTVARWSIRQSSSYRSCQDAISADNDNETFQPTLALAADGCPWPTVGVPGSGWKLGELLGYGARSVPPSPPHPAPCDSAIVPTASYGADHANPLAPLRKRDSIALAEFFDKEDIQEISMDVHRYLSRIYPEPCWEDEPYEFLHGYI